MLLVYLAKKALTFLPTALFAELRPLYYLAVPVCSSCSAQACHSANSLLVSAVPTSLPLQLSLCPCYTFLFSVLLAISHSLPHLAGTIIFLTLYYQAAIGSRSFILQKMTRPTSWADWVPCSWLILTHVVSFLPYFFLNPLYLFSYRRSAISSKFFNTKAPSVFTDELVFHFQAPCVFSSFRRNGHSLLLRSLYL